jgi:hypothetical protein
MPFNVEKLKTFRQPWDKDDLIVSHKHQSPYPNANFNVIIRDEMDELANSVESHTF